MFKELIQRELVSLKRQGFKDKYHIQRLQQMLDEKITFEDWQATGQMMSLKEYENLYDMQTFSKMISREHEDVFRYAGGLCVELTSEGTYYCKPIIKTHANLEVIEEALYEHFKNIQR